MLLTFIVDPPFLLFLGFLFAMAIPMTSRRPLRRTTAFFAGLVTFVIFIVGVVISFWKYPDWMWMYFANVSGAPLSVQGLHLLLGIFVYYLLYCLGFLWGARTKARNNGAAWILLVLLGLASALIIVPFFPRYYSVGTTADYISGNGIPLPKSPLALVYNIAMPLMAVVGGVGFWVARRER